MTNKRIYPFSAIVGQEKLKKALILNVINPNIKGVLISGEKGTGKSLISRSLVDLLDDKSLINLPLNISEDKLVGSIDISEAISKGKKKIDYGLLKRADDNILYIDEVNLLNDYIVNILLEVLSSQTNVIERESISHKHRSDFTLIASMNPEEGKLRSQFLDKFGLYVEVSGEEALENRIKIMERVLEYERNPNQFYQNWQAKNIIIKDKIIRARYNLKDCKIDKKMLFFISDLVKEANCQGHRADLILIETARALAALDNRYDVTMNDIEEAALYVLPHRIRESIEVEEESSLDDKDKSQQDEFEDKETDFNPDISDHIDRSIADEDKLDEHIIEDLLEDIKEISENLPLDLKIKEKNSQEGSGKRNKIVSKESRGRYIRYKMPSQEFVKDIAFDATFRIAALEQKNREKKDLAIQIKKSDIREKIREKQGGAQILFLVDASSSMGARKRMGAVKGAVVSLLNDAYQKRDSVGIIGFRDESSEVLLNITKSVDLAEKCLKNISTGGKTPLALGLEKAYNILLAERAKDPEILQYLVIVSDGKANVPLYSDSPLEDAYDLARKIASQDIDSMVLDTESGFIQYGYAKILAEKLDSKYIKLNDINEDEIRSHVGDLINK